VLLGIFFSFFLFGTRHGETVLRKIRGKWIALKTKGSGRNLKAGKACNIQASKNVSIGDNCTIGKFVDFFPLTFHNGKKYNGEIIIGDRVNIGDYNRFAAMGRIVIEDDVLFAAYVHITDHSHGYIDVNMPIMEQDVYSKGVVRVCRGAWIGFRAELLSGITVGEHSIVAASSVVTKDVPSYSIVAGCPAVVIKKYNQDSHEWERVANNDGSGCQ
jgi:acetyltransferase-like isoleucine patch superfamily enzyme